jgi:hypothetical protein
MVGVRRFLERLDEWDVAGEINFTRRKHKVFGLVSTIGHRDPRIYHPEQHSRFTLPHSSASFRDGQMESLDLRTSSTPAISICGDQALSRHSWKLVYWLRLRWLHRSINKPESKTAVVFQ